MLLGSKIFLIYFIIMISVSLLNLGKYSNLLYPIPWIPEHKPLFSFKKLYKWKSKMSLPFLQSSSSLNVAVKYI
jgi:hypothetical protein